MMVMSYHVELVVRVLLVGASVLVTVADVFVNKYSRMVIVKGKSYGGRRKDTYARQDMYLPALTTKDKCEDKSEYCWQYIQYCQTHRQSLEGRCDKTCKYCNLKNEIKECKDLRSDCRQILWYCPVMRGVCDKTCGFCEKGKTSGNSSKKNARSSNDGLVSARLPEPIFQDILMPALIAGGSNCGDATDFCWHYVQFCKTHKKSLEGKCDKTCGYCKYVGPLEECVDHRSDCGGILYYCPVLKGQCDKTCGYCGSPKCEDKRVDCSFLKVPYCRSHKKRMQKVCAKTCGLCGSLKEEDRSALPALLPQSIFHDLSLPAHTQPVLSRDISLPAKSPGACRDTMAECWHYAQYCKTHRKSLEGRCDRTCNYCGSGLITECVDRRSDCYGILYYCPQLRGQCDQSCGFCGSTQCTDRRPDCESLRDAYCKSHPKRMRQVCPKTCGYCGKVP